MDEGLASTRPLRRDAERNRQLILTAARTLFAQRGLDASLDDVAHEAGLGVGTVYRRFPNREALIDALFDDGLDAITEIIEAARAAPRAWDGLRHFMVSMLELQARDRGLRDVILARRVADPDQDRTRARIKPALDSLVDRAQREGDLRPDLTSADVAVLEISVLGAAEFTGVAAPDAWRRYLAIVLDGMRADPTGPTELPEPPLDEEQLDACMIGWKYASRETRRPRPS